MAGHLASGTRETRARKVRIHVTWKERATFVTCSAGPTNIPSRQQFAQRIWNRTTNGNARTSIPRASCTPDSPHCASIDNAETSWPHEDLNAESSSSQLALPAWRTHNQEYKMKNAGMRPVQPSASRILYPFQCSSGPQAANTDRPTCQHSHESRI
nr:hypothetical protein CFP56_21078 [Quercus suber]